MATSLLDDRLTFAPAAFSSFYTTKANLPIFRTTPNWYDGGTYKVEGYLTYNGVPASRKVSLFTLKDKRLMAETWSDPSNGFYSFTRLYNQPYFVWSEDYLQVYDPISHIAILT